MNRTAMNRTATWMLALIPGATTATLLVLTAGAPALAQSTFHGNVERTGVYAEPGPKSEPAVKWAFKTGGPVIGSPVIADGVVYIASLSGYLYAVDQATGRE